MNDCVFCQIISKEIPCYQIYEDKIFFGFLDNQPLNPGHSLLIPKTHYRWVDDVPNFGAYFETAKKMAQGVRQALNPITIFYLTFGFGIFHAHIHVLPRFENDNDKEEVIPRLRKNIPPEEMAAIQAKIKACI